MLDVMTFPFVQPILWGDYYRSDPAVLKYVEQLFSDLVAGPYLNGMAQYGVRPGHVHAPVFVDMHKYPAPSAIWDYELQDQLLAWFKGGVVKSPGVDQVNLLYFILPPTETTLKINNGPSDPIGNGVQGWHDHCKYNSASTVDDVIWATLKTNDRKGTSPLNSVQNYAQPVGHECVEAFNDPYDNGRKELGDPCIDNQYTYNGLWPVQQYWSIWDNTCIQGERPPIMPRYFQLVSGYEQIFVVGWDGSLWLEHAPFGTVPPGRELVEHDVSTFQALDFSTVVVLRADQNLWLEEAPFGQVPPRRHQIDATALAFQALNADTVLVLGADQKLWLETAPFGSVPPARHQVDANVLTFHALDEEVVVILGSDRKLWLATAPFGSVPPPRVQIDATARNFSAVDQSAIFVIGGDGSLWLEHAPFGQVPPRREEVDTDVLSVVATSTTDAVWVLRNDGTLWLEHGPFGTTTPNRQQVDAKVQAFHAIDTKNVLVLSDDGNLWLEHAPFAAAAPSRQRVDRTVS
jgi:hypothetical protein